MQGYCKAISYSNYIFCRSRRCCLFIANRKTRCLSLLASFVDCPITSASPTLLKLLTSSYPCTASPVKVDGMPTGSILRKPSVTVWMFGTVMALPSTVVQKYLRRALSKLLRTLVELLVLLHLLLLFCLSSCLVCQRTVSIPKYAFPYLYCAYPAAAVCPVDDPLHLVYYCL